MDWTIYISKKAQKQILKITHKKVLYVFRLLIACLKSNGPIPGKQWPNYGKLNTKQSVDKRHCHLIKGNPTYVCCWEVLDKQQRIIEVYYVGTHEKAPY